MNNNSDNNSSSFKPKYHHVNSHFVRSYTRKDGTLVNGYYRDGDGNPNINSGKGYMSLNSGKKKHVYGK